MRGRDSNTRGSGRIRGRRRILTSSEGGESPGLCRLTGRVLSTPRIRPSRAPRNSERCARKDREIVTYCRTGARAAHDYFVARLLGYEKVRNYDGSWIDWGNRPDLPLERYIRTF